MAGLASVPRKQYVLPALEAVTPRSECGKVGSWGELSSSLVDSCLLGVSPYDRRDSKLCSLLQGGTIPSLGPHLVTSTNSHHLPPKAPSPYIAALASWGFSIEFGVGGHNSGHSRHTLSPGGQIPKVSDQ